MLRPGDWGCYGEAHPQRPAFLDQLQEVGCGRFAAASTCWLVNEWVEGSQSLETQPHDSKWAWLYRPCGNGQDPWPSQRTWSSRELSQWRTPVEAPRCRNLESSVWLGWFPIPWNIGNPRIVTSSEHTGSGAGCWSLRRQNRHFTEFGFLYVASPHKNHKEFNRRWWYKICNQSLQMFHLWIIHAFLCLFFNYIPLQRFLDGVNWGGALSRLRQEIASIQVSNGNLWCNSRKVADVSVSRLCFSHYVVLFPCNSIGSPAFREMSPVHLEVMTWKAILQRLLRRFSGQGEHFSLCRGAATWCWCFEGILWSNSLLLYDHTVKFLMFLNTLLEASRIRLEKALKTFRMTEPGWSTSRIHCKPYALGCVK